MSVFEKQNKSHMESSMFFDGGVDIARYDQVKYPALEKITEKMLGFFWRPEEIDVSKDRSDFSNLTDFEKHIFTSNLKRQILLDSVQGRGPTETFMPAASVPEIEPLVMAWAFFETIHSRSYTHIIRNIYSNPDVVFDTMLDVKEIAECGKEIGLYYDDLIQNNNYATNKREHKRSLYMCLMSANALEGIRFYVSFACSWAFAELKKMEGNAKIIKLIARDENLHLASTQMLLKILQTDDPDFAKIAEETEQECIDMFVDAVDQEKAWADYLFKDGSMIGLNTELLSDYIEWICTRRMNNVNLKSPYKVPQANPLPWTQKWISGAEVQVAPQETEISSYVIGGTKQDVSNDTFKGFSL